MESLDVDFNNIIYPLSNQKNTPSNNKPPNGIYCIENKCSSPKIIQKDSNTFLLNETPFCYNCCISSIIIFSILMLIGSCIALSVMIISDFFGTTTIISKVFFTIICIIGHILLFYITIYGMISSSDYLILGPNTITLLRKILCCKMKSVYNFGELQRAEINYVSNKNEQGRINRYYTFNLVLTSENKVCFFKLDAHKKIIDFMYFKDFIDIINEHIEKKML